MGRAGWPRFGSSSDIAEQLLNEQQDDDGSHHLADSARRLCDSRARYKLTLERHNLGRRQVGLYYADLFHTLINMPNYRFLLLFASSYILMYIFFALLYMGQPRACITRVAQFEHALWFSVQTSATIGYGHMAPDPDCLGLNLIITAEVISTVLLQASLLGVVYARFSSPSRRAATIRFSSVMAMYRGGDGQRRLAFRVANLRNHQVLQPVVRMLLMRRHGAGGEHGCGGGTTRATTNGATGSTISGTASGSEYSYVDLKVGGGPLWLGVPSIVAHTVDAASPLAGVSRAELQAADAEVVVLLDGIDESSGSAIQARHSYFPAHIRFDERFGPVISRRPSGRLGVDFGDFDRTSLTEEGVEWLAAPVGGPQV